MLAMHLGEASWFLAALSFCAILVVGECESLVYEGPSHMRLTHKFANLPGRASEEGHVTFEHHRRILAHDRLRILRIFKNQVSDKSAKAAAKAGKEADKSASKANENVGKMKSEVLSDPTFSGGGKFSLYGSAEEYGLYYTRIGLGNPSQEYNVMIDTGSHLLWVDCEPCYQCPSSSIITKLSPPYDPSESSSSEELDCSSMECLNAQTQLTQMYGCEDMSSDDKKCYYNVTYGDGSSTAGYILKDDFEFSALDGTRVVTPMTLGCGNFQTGNLYRGGDTVDGLIGLAKSPLSIPSQLYRQNLTSNVFSHCLGGEKNGGILVFGRIISPNISYTPMVNNDDFYSVKLVGLTKDGKSLPGITVNSFINVYRPNAIIDCGTTLAYIPDAVYRPWLATVKGEVQNLELIPEKDVEGLICWEFGKRSYSDLNDFFPDFALHFDGGRSMNVTPLNYVILYTLDNGDNAACIAWRSSVGIGLTLLGEILFRDRVIIYDRELNQIGWMDHDCSKVSLSVIGKYDSQVVTVQDYVTSPASQRPKASYLGYSFTFTIIIIIFVGWLF